MRISGRAFIVLAAIVALAIVYATGQIAPAETAYQAQMRIWLAARATGITALILLTLQVALGLVLSHPTNQTTWRLSKRIFPWHEHLLLFTASLLALHVVSLIADPYAGVGIGGALIPGLSEYRTSAVALGTLAVYALIATSITARYTRLLPAGVWLKLHRLSLVVLVLAWLHGILAGTDSGALRPLYLASFGLVVAVGAQRYWVSRRARQVERQGAIAVGTPSRPATPSRPPAPVSTFASRASVPASIAPGQPLEAAIGSRLPGGDR
jgi:sulfoxide reductase heme-binding subunit YedZ